MTQRRCWRWRRPALTESRLPLYCAVLCCTVLYTGPHAPGHPPPWIQWSRYPDASLHVSVSLPLTSADLGCISIYIDFYRFLCVYLSDVGVSRYQARRHRHPLSLCCGQAWCETLPVQCSPAVYCTALYCTVLCWGDVWIREGEGPPDHPRYNSHIWTSYLLYLYLCRLPSFNCAALHCTIYNLSIKILFYTWPQLRRNWDLLSLISQTLALELQIGLQLTIWVLGS